MSLPRLASLALAALVLLQPVADAAGSQVRIPPYERVVLPNGLTLITLRRAEVPLIGFTAVVRGGAAADPADKAGVASLTAGLLEKGAGRRDAFQFADDVANVGGSFGASAGAESISVGGQFLARDRALMIEVLADALLRPRFEPAEFDKLRTRQVEFIKAAKDSDPSSLVPLYARAFLFGSHPYGTPVPGSEGSLARLTIDDVRAYHRRVFAPERTTIVVAGDIDPKWLRRAVSAAFSAWPRSTEALPALPASTPVQGRRVLLVDSPGSVQFYFWMGNVGVARGFPQRPALDIVNTLYGGRFTSILNTELRVRTGLSYGASSGFNRGTVAGEFGINSFALAENADKALALALETLTRLHAEGVSEEMLESARRYVLGQYPTRLETAANWASTLADLEFFGLPREFIEGYGPALERVTVEDARRVIAGSFPKPEDLVIVMIGDAAKLRDVAAKLGPVTEMPLAAPEFR